MKTMNINNIIESQKSSESSSKSSKKKKTNDDRFCALCKNHNLLINTTKHKRYCLGRLCICPKCIEKRKVQSNTAAVTKQGRRDRQDIDWKDKMEKNSQISRPNLVDPSKPVDVFIISEEDRKNIIMITNGEEVTFQNAKRDEREENPFKKEFLASDSHEITPAEQHREMTPKTNVTSSCNGEIYGAQSVDHNNNFRDLLFSTLVHCMSLWHPVLYAMDFRTSHALIGPSANELVDVIFEHARISNSTTDAQKLEESKHVVRSTSVIRHLKIIWRTITRNVILSSIMGYLTHYLFLYIYYLFPP